MLPTCIENRRRNVMNLNQPWGLSAKMAAKGIRTHAQAALALIVACWYIFMFFFQDGRLIDLPLSSTFLKLLCTEASSCQKSDHLETDNIKPNITVWKEYFSALLKKGSYLTNLLHSYYVIMHWSHLKWIFPELKTKKKKLFFIIQP